MKEKTYEAIYLPACSEGKNPSKGGFKTEEEAIEYVKKHLCSYCKDDLENGYIILNYGYKKEKMYITDALETSCGAEWIVDEEDKDLLEIKQCITEEELAEVINKTDKESEKLKKSLDVSLEIMNRTFDC
jgi:hypothetical protein